MVVMPPLSSKSNAGSFGQSLMPTLSCRRSSLRWIKTKKYPTYWRSVTYTMPLNQGCLQCVPGRPSMPSAKAINLRRASHRRVPHTAPTVPLTLPWPWQLSCMECHLQWLFQKRLLVHEVPQFWYCRQTCCQTQWSCEGPPSLSQGKGEESWHHTSQHWGHTPMWWIVCWYSWLWKCRRHPSWRDSDRWCPHPKMQWSIHHSETACKQQQ